MNYRVPEFEMEGDYSLPASSPRSRKSTMPEDEVMELLWQNGQVVMQSQTQRSGHKKSKYDAVLPEHTRPPAAQPPPVNQYQNPQLFMQEDEMAAWLQCPLGDDDPFCAELLYTDSRNAQSSNTAANLPQISPPPPPPPRLPIHPPPPAPRRTELPNFLHFSRMTNNNKSRYESAAVGPSGSKSVDSRFDASSNNASGGGRGLAATATMSFGAAASAGKDAVTCETSLTSSTGDSSASGSLSAEQMSIQKPPPPPPPLPVEDRKRKERVADDAECQSEDVEFESGSGKKQTRGSSSTKRSRAAEVHNLSERRRRDRINEKMRSLQELIPRCNKSDKASMLDEAIEYLKSLQLQVQMMSMGCGMVPMMFPGVQQYMPMGMGMGVGMGMGMGMGMEMGMSRPMMPFPNVLAGSTMPTAPATAHMGPRFPLPPFRMQTMLPNDPSRVQATNQSEHMLNSLGTQNQNQSRVTNFADPYQQYFTPQQMRMQLQQNQAMPQPSSSKPSSSMGPENQERHQ